MRAQIVRRLSVGLLAGTMTLGSAAIAPHASAAPVTPHTAVVTVKQQAALPASAAPQTVMAAITSSTCRQYTWSGGSTGYCVRYIQNLFDYLKNDYGWCRMSRSYADLAVDGVYGPKTVAAIKYLQWHCNAYGTASLTLDGIVGPKTWYWMPALG